MSQDYTPRLIKMANQIAINQPAEVLGEEAAVAAVRSHIEKFWDPRMREKIIAHLPGDSGELNDIARKAVAQLKTS